MSILTSYIVPHPPLIVPEVGRGQENKIMDTINAYHNVAREISEIKPETIVVITPHSVIYQDYIHISPCKYSSLILAKIITLESTAIPTESINPATLGRLITAENKARIIKTTKI